MPQPFRNIFTHPRLVITVSIILGLVILLTVFRLVYFEPWLQKKIENTVSRGSKGLYTFQVKKLNASLLSGGLQLDGLQLTPHAKVWQQQQKNNEKDLAPMLFQVNVAQLKLTGLNYFKILFQKKPALHEAILVGPQLVLTQMKKDTSQMPLYQKLPEALNGFRIGTIQITQGALSYKIYPDTSVVVALKEVNFNLQNLLLNHQAYEDPKRFFYARQIKLQAQQAQALTPDKVYRFKTGKIQLSTADKSMNLAAVKLVPLYTVAGLSRIKGSAQPQLQLTIPAISLQEVNFPDFSRFSHVTVGSIRVEKPVLKAEMDTKNFEQKGPKPLIYELVQEITGGFTIEEFIIDNMNIYYEELAPKATKKGYLYVKNLQATISNLTNNKTRMTVKNPAIIKGNADIMGQAHMQAEIRINILDPSGKHTISGSVGKMDPKIFNPIVEPSHYASVKSGIVHKGTFWMQFTKNAVSGTMNLHYEDFKIDLLSKKKESELQKKPEKKQSIGKKILSVVANKIILNSNNKPEPENTSVLGIGEYKVGKINSARRQNRSVITFWMDGLTSGVRSTLGLNSQVPY